MQPIHATEVPAAALAEQLYDVLQRLLLHGDSDHFGAIEDQGLSLSQMRALLLLAAAEPEPLTGGGIAEALGVSPAAMSRALEALAGRDLLARAASPDDRRVRLLTLTASGRRVAGELTALRRARLERFAAGLEPAQRARLHDALADINRGEATA